MSQKSAFAQADLPTLQVALTKQGMPPKALQAIRMLLASRNLYSSHSVADFEKQIDPLHEETCLQVGNFLGGESFRIKNMYYTPHDSETLTAYTASPVPEVSLMYWRVCLSVQVCCVQLFVCSLVHSYVHLIIHTFIPSGDRVMCCMCMYAQTLWY